MVYSTEMRKTAHNVTSSTSRIRPETARLVVAAAKVLFEADAIGLSELAAIREALTGLARATPEKPEKRLVDLHEVARILAVSEQSLKRWLADGSINLPKVRVGQGAVRFRLCDIEQLVDNVEFSVRRPQSGSTDAADAADAKNRINEKLR